MPEILSAAKMKSAELRANRERREKAKQAQIGVRERLKPQERSLPDQIYAKLLAMAVRLPGDVESPPWSGAQSVGDLQAIFSRHRRAEIIEALELLVDQHRVDAAPRLKFDKRRRKMSKAYYPVR